MMERDPAPASEPYCYTTFIQLKEILDKRWTLVSTYLPKQLATNKRQLLDYFNELNIIRNVVMHPVKGLTLSDERFEVVTRVCQLVSVGLEVADLQSSRAPEKRPGRSPEGN